MKFLFKLLLFASFCIISCKRVPCSYSEPVNVMSVQMGQDTERCRFDYVLIEGISRSCLDSAKIINLIEKYVVHKKEAQHYTVQRISVLSKVVDFDNGENLSQSKSFFENEILSILLDTINNKPKEFTFYNSSGEVEYRDSIWHN